MSYLTRDQIEAMGFASVGNNVLISDRASFYGADRISIGNNVRIDDYAVLSAGLGGIEIGNYIHIAIYSSLVGAGKICLCDFCNISSRVSIYSSNDDYSGAFLTNSMVPNIFSCVTQADVILMKHVIIGSGSIVLPGVVLHEGVAIGALSLVKKSCDPYGIYCGNPLKRIKERKMDLIELEQKITEMTKLDESN